MTRSVCTNRSSIVLMSFEKRPMAVPSFLEAKSALRFVQPHFNELLFFFFFFFFACRINKHSQPSFPLELTLRKSPGGVPSGPTKEEAAPQVPFHLIGTHAPPLPCRSIRNRHWNSAPRHRRSVLKAVSSLKVSTQNVSTLQ